MYGICPGCGLKFVNGRFLLVGMNRLSSNEPGMASSCSWVIHGPVGDDDGGKNEKDFDHLR
ncbi:MAG TPA: hypothetical protein DDW65_04185 [Firmicutes bacterium]|nr:hypothetical protein [Bacillota bacterium]